MIDQDIDQSTLQEQADMEEAVKEATGKANEKYMPEGLKIVKPTIQTINIHGKQYVPVAERLKQANGDLLQIRTDIITNDENEVLVKATVETKKGIFTGHASSNKKAPGIEGQSSVEVAETSALGRALGFAGYGVLESIASAEEIVKAENGSKCRYCGATGQYHKPNCPGKS